MKILMGDNINLITRQFKSKAKNSLIMSWWIPGTRLPTKPRANQYCIIMIIFITAINIFSLPASGVHEILAYQSFVSLCKKCTSTFAGYHRRSLYSRRKHAEAKKKKRNKTNTHMLKTTFYSFWNRSVLSSFFHMRKICVHPFFGA